MIMVKLDSCNVQPCEISSGEKQANRTGNSCGATYRIVIQVDGYEECVLNECTCLRSFEHWPHACTSRWHIHVLPALFDYNNNNNKLLFI